jgi:hypothetical protein
MVKLSRSAIRQERKAIRRIGIRVVRLYNLERKQQQRKDGGK